MAVALTVSLRDFEAADRRLANLAAFDTRQLLDELGQLVEGQTKRRIMSEKTAPDGEAWQPNRSGTSILVQSGALHDSIAHLVSGDAAQVGSNLVYAGIHQTGGKAGRGRKVTIPARPYLGLSDENRADINDQIEDFLERLVR